jgi:shikimate dehydrogenase
MKSPRLLGLLGHPVGHSKSPELFKARLSSIDRSEISYQAFDLESISDFPSFCGKHSDLFGFNVTIPHKESIIPFLDSLSEEATVIGAVNTVVKTPSGWKGYNTDSWGFIRSLAPFIKGRHERALIFGSGGASKAVAYTLKNLGISTTIISRSPSLGQIAYSDLTPEALSHHLLLVNCTPLGTAPHIEGCIDLPWSGLGERHLVVDLVYNPEITTFMKRAKAQGAQVINGADMLRLQAKKSLEIWLENGL